MTVNVAEGKKVDPLFKVETSTTGREGSELVNLGEGNLGEVLDAVFSNLNARRNNFRESSILNNPNHTPSTPKEDTPVPDPKEVPKAKETKTPSEPPYNQTPQVQAKKSTLSLIKSIIGQVLFSRFKSNLNNKNPENKIKSILTFIKPDEVTNSKVDKFVKNLRSIDFKTVYGGIKLTTAALVVVVFGILGFKNGSTEETSTIPADHPLQTASKVQSNPNSRPAKPSLKPTENKEKERKITPEERKMTENDVFVRPDERGKLTPSQNSIKNQPANTPREEKLMSRPVYQKPVETLSNLNSKVDLKVPYANNDQKKKGVPKVGTITNKPIEKKVEKHVFTKTGIPRSTL